MAEWWSYLKGRPFYWALDGANPAAALLMIRHVVERPSTAPARRAARAALYESAGVVALAARLGDEEGEAPFDRLLWRLRLLAELGVTRRDEESAEALDRLLDRPGDGGIVAYDAILLHIAAQLGYPDEPRALAAQQRLAATLAAGELPEAPEARACWLSQVLLALSALTDRERDLQLLRGVEGELARLSPAQLPSFEQWGFPLYDQPDGLALARAALQAGARGEWLERWVERIVAAQDGAGLWRLERLRPLPEGLRWDAAAGQPSRWITAQALFVLRAFYGE